LILDINFWCHSIIVKNNYFKKIFLKYKNGNVLKTLTKTENCILVKITSENNNSLSPQPPIIMAIQGVLCNEVKEEENNVSSLMSSEVIDIDEWDLYTKKKKYKAKSNKKIRLEMIPLFSCMELENIIDIVHEYRDNISKMKIISSLTEEEIRAFSNNVYSFISHLNIIPNHIFVEFFTKYMLNYDLTGDQEQYDKNKSLLELSLNEDENGYRKDLCIDKDVILQDIYKTPKPKKTKNQNKDGKHIYTLKKLNYITNLIHFLIIFYIY